MKTMKSLTSKAQKLVLLLGMTGVVFTTLPSQAEAGGRTIFKRHGLTLRACHPAPNFLKFSGFYAGPRRNGFLYGDVGLHFPSFGWVHLTQGRWVGNGVGGAVNLNPRYVWLRGKRVDGINVSFTKGFERSDGIYKVTYPRSIGAATMRGLPKCGIAH